MPQESTTPDLVELLRALVEAGNRRDFDEYMGLRYRSCSPPTPPYGARMPAKRAASEYGGARSTPSGSLRNPSPAPATWVWPYCQTILFVRGSITITRLFLSSLARVWERLRQRGLVQRRRSRGRVAPLQLA